jgi:hypothetical protein
MLLRENRRADCCSEIEASKRQQQMHNATKTRAVSAFVALTMQQTQKRRRKMPVFHCHNGSS